MLAIRIYGIKLIIKDKIVTLLPVMVIIKSYVKNATT